MHYKPLSYPALPTCRAPVLTWNQKIDQTAPRTIDELIDLCIADASPRASNFRLNQAVIDVGRATTSLPVILQRRLIGKVLRGV